jgi:hypothetical protein
VQSNFALLYEFVIARYLQMLLMLLFSSLTYSHEVSQNLGHQVDINYVIASEKVRSYISVGGKQVGIWDAKTGFLSGFIELPGYPRHVDVSPDGKMLIVIWDQGVISSYDILTGKLIKESVYDKVLRERVNNDTSIMPLMMRSKSPSGDKVFVVRSPDAYVFDLNRPHDNPKYIIGSQFKRGGNNSPMIKGGEWNSDGTIKLYIVPRRFTENEEWTTSVLEDGTMVPGARVVNVQPGHEFPSNFMYGSRDFGKSANTSFGQAKVDGRNLIISIIGVQPAAASNLTTGEGAGALPAQIVKADLIPNSRRLVIAYIINTSKKNNTNKREKNFEIVVLDTHTLETVFRRGNIEDYAITPAGKLAVLDDGGVSVFESKHFGETCILKTEKSDDQRGHRTTAISSSYDREVVAAIHDGYPQLLDVASCKSILTGGQLLEYGIDIIDAVRKFKNIDSNSPLENGVHTLEFVKGTPWVFREPVNVLFDIDKLSIVGRPPNESYSPFDQSASPVTGGAGVLLYRKGGVWRSWKPTKESICRVKLFGLGTKCDEYGSLPADSMGQADFYTSNDASGYLVARLDGNIYKENASRKIVVSHELAGVLNEDFYRKDLDYSVRYIGNSSVNITPIILSDGRLRLFGGRIENPVVVVSIANSGAMLINTTDGYFATGDATSVSQTAVSVGGHKYPIAAFWDVFNRPDIVRSAIAGEDYRPLIGDLTIEKALQSPPPTVHDIPTPEAGHLPARIRIPYTVKDEGGGIGEVLVLHNGKLIQSDGYYKDAPGSSLVAVNTTKATSEGAVQAAQKKLGSGVSTESGSNTRDRIVVRQAKPKPLNSKGEYTGSVEVEVIPGEENEITVMARNKDNTILGQGKSIRFISNLPKAEPHLWIYSVGIGNFKDRIPRLASPKKDALDFACAYGGGKAPLKQAGIDCDKSGYAQTLFKPENIHVISPLIDGQATRANILAKLDEIARQAKPSDTFIWFVSSHGTMDANSVYGIVPHDAKCLDAECKNVDGLVTSNDILEKSKAIKAMKQVLVLDTCQAGGLDNKMSGLYDARMSGLAKNMGLHLYAAATATESALDGQDTNKNSVFTATLLEGLSGLAPDKDRDNRISVIELGDYAKTRTPEASRKIWGEQSVQIPVIQHFGKDAPLVGTMGARQ